MKLTSKKKITSVCNSVQQNITMQNLNETDIFLTKWKLIYEKNHFGAAKPRISTIQKTKLDTR
jgi:hypothetical protein